MPALTDRNHSSNLVAVEASMEDGTSRTLYIDPAYLEPNVDLSNLMLHIDNSGQETVIIPSSSAQDTESLTTVSGAQSSSATTNEVSSSSVDGKTETLDDKTGQEDIVESSTAVSHGK